MLQVHPEVAEALAAGTPVVALESTILAHGLPRGDNRRIADRIEQQVRAGGAIPATIAVLDGAVRIGLDDRQLDRLCAADDIVKLSVRDLGTALSLGVDGATTVASTSALAFRAGIAVFAHSPRPEQRGGAPRWTRKPPSSSPPSAGTPSCPG